jgi:hypothetical protein
MDSRRMTVHLNTELARAFEARKNLAIRKSNASTTVGIKKLKYGKPIIDLFKDRFEDKNPDLAFEIFILKVSQYKDDVLPIIEKIYDDFIKTKMTIKKTTLFIQMINLLDTETKANTFLDEFYLSLKSMFNMGGGSYSKRRKSTKRKSSNKRKTQKHRK